MRIFLTTLLIVAGGIWPAHADERGVGIRAVITAQVDAFRADDGKAAFAIAAPEIQKKFRDAPTFLAMVAAAYPQVYRPAKIVFLDLVEADGKLVQRVLMTGPKGQTVMALYDMVQIDGQWRINGCALVAAPGKDT